MGSIRIGIKGPSWDAAIRATMGTTGIGDKRGFERKGFDGQDFPFPLSFLFLHHLPFNTTLPIDLASFSILL